MSISITEVSIKPVKPDQKGLIAFASFVINGSLYLSSVGIVTKRSGGYRLVYPAKQVGEHYLQIFHPINYSTATAIENAVLEKVEAFF